MTGFGWLMMVVLVILGSALMAMLRHLEHHPLSLLARVVVAGLPMFAWVALGALDRCFPAPLDHRCHYFAPGLVFFLPFFAAWLLGSLGALVTLRSR